MTTTMLHVEIVSETCLVPFLVSFRNGLTKTSLLRNNVAPVDLSLHRNMHSVRARSLHPNELEQTVKKRLERTLETSKRAASKLFFLANQNRVHEVVNSKRSRVYTTKSLRTKVCFVRNFFYVSLNKSPRCLQVACLIRRMFMER